MLGFLQVHWWPDSDIYTARVFGLVYSQIDYIYIYSWYILLGIVTNQYNTSNLAEYA